MWWNSTLILNVHSLFQGWLHSEVLGIKCLIYMFWGNNSTHNSQVVPHTHNSRNSRIIYRYITTCYKLVLMWNYGILTHEQTDILKSWVILFFKTLTQSYFEIFNMINYNMSAFLNFIFNFRNHFKAQDQMALLMNSTGHIKKNWQQSSLNSTKIL